MLHPEFRTSGQSTLRPDLVVVSVTPNIYIDVTVPYDPAEHMEKKAQAKKDKYRHLGVVFPFVVGALGSWWPENDNLRAALQIPPRAWANTGKAARLAAIQGTTAIINKHLGYNEPDGSGVQEDPEN